MIQRAQEKARAAQVDVNFQAGLVEKIQFADGTFDVVMNSLMFHHLPSLELKQAALAEMYRVLKPAWSPAHCRFRAAQARPVQNLPDADPRRYDRHRQYNRSATAAKGWLRQRHDGADRQQSRDVYRWH